MRGYEFATAALSALTISATALAAEPALQPGKWAVRVTATMPLAKEPMDSSLTQCIRDGNTNPVENLLQQGKCTQTSRTVVGKTLQWEMTCKTGRNGVAIGKGEFTSDGVSGTATMEMTTQFQGKPLTSKTTWTGKRVGECD